MSYQNNKMGYHKSTEKLFIQNNILKVMNIVYIKSIGNPIQSIK